MKKVYVLLSTLIYLIATPVFAGQRLDQILTELVRFETLELDWHEGPLLVIEGGREPASLSNWATLGKADKDLVDLGYSLLAFYQSQGDEAKTIIVQRTANGLFVAKDGQLSLPSKDIRQILIDRIMARLGNNMGQIQPQNIAQIFQEIGQSAPEENPPIEVSAGGRVQFMIDGLVLKPRLALPNGVSLVGLQETANGWQVTISASSDMDAGTVEIGILSKDDTIDPHITQTLDITAQQNAYIPPPIDDHGNDVQTATVIEASSESVLSGQISGAQDQDIFTFTLDQTQTVRIETKGQSDLQLSIASQGQTLAQDDDGGVRYNAKLSQTLAPGTYYVTVRHCCGGNGVYELETNITE
jgi:hypothetical protein